MHPGPAWEATRAAEGLSSSPGLDLPTHLAHPESTFKASGLPGGADT